MSEPIMEIDEDGTKCWYLNGKYHREDGPAVEYADGNKEWYLNGKYHREDGPAVEYADGNKEWWLSGYKEWWLNGCPYSKEEYTLLMFFGK